MKVGIPVHSVSVLGASYGTGPKGEEWIYAVANGDPAIFNVIDTRSGNREFSYPLEGASGSWGVTVAPDGTYISQLIPTVRFTAGYPEVKESKISGSPFRVKPTFGELKPIRVGESTVERIRTQRCSNTIRKLVISATTVPWEKDMQYVRSLDVGDGNINCS